MTGDVVGLARGIPQSVPTLPETPAWVVIGAGIIGAATAAQLARGGESVLVVDAAATPASGATGASGGMVRCYDPDPLVAQLATASLAVYADPTAWVDGMAPLQGVGAVTVGGPEHAGGFAAVTRAAGLAGWNCEVVAGAEAVLGVRTASRIALVEYDAGWVDPVSVTRLFLRQAVEYGAGLSLGTQVTGLSTVAGGGVRMATDRGNITATEGVLVAAGPWVARAPFVGMVSPGTVRSRSIQTVMIGRPADVPSHATFIDLRSGAYGKPEPGGTTRVGYPLLVWDVEQGIAPDTAHPEHTLAAVIDNLPWARGCRPLSITRSFDAYGACDDVLLRTALPNVWLCRPSSGGGVRVAPELGRVIAQRLSRHSGDRESAGFRPS